MLFSMRFIVILFLFSSYVAHAQSFSFRDEDIPESLREYIVNNAPPPGRYLVDIYINNELSDSREIDFYADTDKKTSPCLTTDYLLSIGVKTDGHTDNSGCVNINNYEYASWKFDFTAQKLKLNIPQSMLKKNDKAIATVIDYGIPAIFTNYRGNAYSLRTQGQSNTSNYTLNTTTGINLGAWRYRLNTYGMKSPRTSEFDVTGNYVERSLFDHKSRLIIGDTYTNSSAFSNTRLSGLQLFSDDSMSDYNDTTYTPVVRGIARSPSRLTVRQGQYIVLSKNIPAGPFSYEVEGSVYNGGNLDVEIIGDDGDTQQYSLQSNAMSIMRAPGSVKYNLFAGKTANTPLTENVASAEIYYGFPFDVTGLAGARISNQSTSLATGFAADLGRAGGIGVYFSGTKRKTDGTGTKQSFQYRKRLFSDTFLETEYNIYRHYREPFYPGDSICGQRNTWRASLNHSFRRAGYLSARAEEGICDGKKNSQLSVAHNISFGRFNLQTSLQKNSYPGRDTDTVLALNLSSSFLSPAFSASYGLTRKKNEDRHNISLYGQYSFDNNYLNWRYQGSKSSLPEQSGNHYISARLDNERGSQSVSYSSSGSTEQYSLNAEGGIVFHSSGIYAGKEISGTTALINTRGISGIKISGSRGVTNDSGYMLMQYLRPFQNNDISLDATSIPDDVSVANIKKTVWPDNNAILMVDFSARRGQDILYTVYAPDGKALPFGAVATYTQDEQNLRGGIVDEGGSLYLSGLEPEGIVTIQYGPELRCSFPVTKADFNTPGQEVTKHCKS